VAASSLPELRRQRDSAEGADLVELRLDYVEGLAPEQVRDALEGRRRPAIVTCRPASEGGRFAGGEDDRRRILNAAVSAGAEFVDVEARAAFAAEIIRSRRGRGVVLSTHLFGPPPDDLGERVTAMRSTGAEIVKLAIEAGGLSDTIALIALSRDVSNGTGPGHVLIAMGEPGVPSRVLAAQLRNRWTYAGDGVAPGQLPFSRLVGELRFRSINDDTAVYGVVGNPVAHSRSPAMHNAGFAALGINASYIPLHARDADDFVRFARALPLAGASITAPFKVDLMAHLDEVDDLARRVGAINTIIVRGGKWLGANTDVHGFLTPLSGRIRVRGVRASVLGSGGAARGVAIALADQGATVTVCARRPEAAHAIADLVSGHVGMFPPRAGSWDVLVNATTVGTGSTTESPIPGAALDGEIVFDLVYVPAETRLLADARAAGCLTIGGMEMLVAQAEKQFELWTGYKPPPGLFTSAANGSGSASSGSSAAANASSAGPVGRP
jgi:3-dehydroquinate dehydratase/shikimate dehydrogenase